MIGAIISVVFALLAIGAIANLFVRETKWPEPNWREITAEQDRKMFLRREEILNQPWPPAAPQITPQPPEWRHPLGEDYRG